MRSKTVLILFLVLGLFLSACASFPNPLQPPTPTASPSPTVTLTPLPPTATLTLTPTPSRTPAPTRDYGATTTAEANLTQTVIEDRVRQEMTRMGLPTDKGSLGWAMSSSYNTGLDDPSQFAYHLLGDNQVFDNFIFKTEVDWNSTARQGSCGVFFRASDFVLHTASYYIFAPMFKTGAPTWDFLFIHGGSSFQDLMGHAQLSQRIKTGAYVSNTFMLVVNQNLLTAYVNGDRLGSAIDGKRKSGYVGLFVLQEGAGKTDCTYSDTWIWKLP